MILSLRNKTIGPMQLSLVVNFFCFCQIEFVCSNVAMWDLVHDVEMTFYLLYTANSIWKSFRKYNLQFTGFHSYFRNDFQILLTVNRGHVLSPYCALGHTCNVNAKQSNLTKQKKKKIDHKKNKLCCKALRVHQKTGYLLSLYELRHEKSRFLHMRKQTQIRCAVTTQLRSTVYSSLPLLPKFEISSL